MGKVRMVAVDGVLHLQLPVAVIDVGGIAAQNLQAFGRLVEAAIASGNLSIKFLFEVNGTAFSATGDLTRQYPMWQRQIAQKIDEKGACLEVSGHASRTGTEAYNDRLSARRAESVAKSLVAIRPELRGRLTSTGKGFAENIVGSGTDDAQDAIDRRVEFKIVPCKG